VLKNNYESEESSPKRLKIIASRPIG